MSTKLLALAASTRADSLNKKLLAIAIAHAERAGAQVSVLDYSTCDAPMYGGNENDTLPPGARRFSDAVQAHDGILLASPEYNWSMPGALKNLIDWLSVDKPMPLRGKSALLMCASPSPRGGILGLNQLSLPLAHLGVYVYPHVIAISDAERQLAGTRIANDKDNAFLAQCVTDFVRVTNGVK